MIEIATISLLSLGDNQPAVKLSAAPEFLEMSPLDRVIHLIAAAQLCSAAIAAVCEDSDEEINVEELFETLAINPSERSAMN